MRPARGAAMWSLTMISCGTWAAAAGIDMLGADYLWKIIWVRIVYAGITGTVFFWTLFVFSYSEYEPRLNRRTVLLLSIAPACMFLALLTFPYHSLVYQNLHMAQSHGMAFLEKNYGPVFLIWAAYSYSAIVIGAFVLVRTALQSPRLFRGQSLTLILGAVIPTIANFLYVTGHNPIEPFDPSALAFTITGILIVYGIRTYRFLDIAPVAMDLVFRNVSAGVMILDQKGQILDLNPVAERILNCRQEDVLGKALHTSFPHYRNLIEQFRNVLEVTTEIQMSEKIYELQLTPLISRGKTVGRIVLLYDITERKRAMEEREKLIRELDAYAHTVAHDLKSPLTTIIGYMDFIQKASAGKRAEDFQRQLNAVARSSQKMASIIDELLSLSRIRGQSEIPSTVLSMREVLRIALMRVTGMIEEYGADVQIGSCWPDAMGHGPWVEEIWVNYLSNAMKYGGSPPRIQVGADDLQDGFHRYWVEDNGSGLSDEERASLFVEFYRLERHSGREGHGLGLSIVKRIAERLGGQAGAENGASGGTRFYFTLPASKPMDSGPEV